VERLQKSESAAKTARDKELETIRTMNAKELNQANEILSLSKSLQEARETVNLKDEKVLELEKSFKLRGDLLD
jgi:hypothetical protein